METLVERKIKALVFNKYGEKEVRNALKIAETHFWQILHNMLIGSDKMDESIGIDIEDTLLTAATEYVFENDRCLQAELDRILEDIGL